MGTRFLTKSAFKIGRSCPTKLFYYRSGYPSNYSNNPYLEFLADGGHIVGKLAQLLFPEGILIRNTGTIDDSLRRTEEELKKGDVVLFEAAFRAGNKVVLVDVLRKTGNTVELIEVKSKSYDSDQEEAFKQEGRRTTFTNSRADIDASWRSYLEDICYQTYVVSLAHPEFQLTPYLYLPDKAKSTPIDNLAGMFNITEVEGSVPNRKYLEVIFTGDQFQVTERHFMTLVNVEKEVQHLWDEVTAAAEILDQSLIPSLIKLETPLGRHCAKCEYNVKLADKNGFKECWGPNAYTDPHIFDLYFGTTIEKGELFDSLIQEKKTSLFDVPTETLSGKRGTRQSIQINNTRTNEEWFSDTLHTLITDVEYPLHFVDFETSRIAVPYHKDMRPYEQVAFQWSCHTVSVPGADPVHSEWINTVDMFPNFEFARTLKDQIGSIGTMLTWAHHESSVLKDIARQMEKYKQLDTLLLDWISDLVDEESGRILDLNRTTLDHYFHPEMKGRTSLKAVLPAIWNNNEELHDIPWLKRYVVYQDNRKVLDPYKTLAKIEIAGAAESVQEGTGAMRAYQDMMYGKGRDLGNEVKESWKKLLLQYCELDTIAMLVVWTHWERKVRGVGYHSKQ